MTDEATRLAKQQALAALAPPAQERAVADAAIHGIGFTKDGQHVPLSDMYGEGANFFMTAAQIGAEKTAHSGTYLGYKIGGREMHCANAFCPHQHKCRRGCTNRVAREVNK